MKHRVIVTKTRLGAFIATAATLATAVGVLAYMVATASGAITSPSGVAIATATPISLTGSTTNQTHVTTPGGATDSAWNFGDTQTFTTNVINPSATESVTLHQVTLQSWTSDAAGCNSSVNSGALAGTFAMTPVPFSTTLSPGSGTVLPGLTVTFTNLTSTDQSACLGATPSFVFLVS
jgi:hypothetical protein